MPSLLLQMAAKLQDIRYKVRKCCYYIFSTETVATYQINDLRTTVLDAFHLNCSTRVKQSAARQSWHADASPPPRPTFSIATKTGRYEGPTWIAEPGRNAEIFIFAWHPVADATADHRDPDQWQFFVVPETALPAQKSISLSALARLVDPVPFANLSACVTDTTVTVHAHQGRRPPA